MRLALFHNWSSLGLDIANALLGDGVRDLVLIGAPVEPDRMDLGLVRHARETGVPCIVAPSARDDALTSGLRALAPDVLLVATYPEKLPESALGIARYGSFNVHASLLPKYRGAHPEFWVVREGATETGVTVHRMTERIDAGPIVLQERIRLDPSETLGSLVAKTSPIAIGLVRRLLESIRRGDLPVAVEQDEAAATRAPKVRPAHLSVDWQDGAASIDRLVRACHPHFEARASIGGRERVIVRCRLLPGAEDLLPGESRALEGSSSVEVGTGRGNVAVVLAADVT